MKLIHLENFRVKLFPIRAFDDGILRHANNAEEFHLLDVLVTVSALPVKVGGHTLQMIVGATG